MATRSHQNWFLSAAAAAVLLLGCSLIPGALWPQAAQANETPAGNAGRPLPPSQPVEELAAYMSQLQIYTHKLSLSLDAGNKELGAFYFHESLALLDEIQEKVPEYEGIPVAVYVDRYGLPAYEGLRQELRKSEIDRNALNKGMDAVIKSCNTCHAASQHGFIKIKRNSVNPFYQDFAP